MKVCILNSTTNIVENIVEVENLDNIPSFIVGEGQVLATDHTGEMGDTWTGSSYDTAHRYKTYTDEQKWEDIRNMRNRKLAETDFYALSDVTMTTEMSNYRQALRDLPSSTSNPDDVVFPTKP
jgi:hypothetical protein